MAETKNIAKTDVPTSVTSSRLTSRADQSLGLLEVHQSEKFGAPTLGNNFQPPRNVRHPRKGFGLSPVFTRNHAAMELQDRANQFEFIIIIDLSQLFHSVIHHVFFRYFGNCAIEDRPYLCRKHSAGGHRRPSHREAQPNTREHGCYSSFRPSEDVIAKLWGQNPEWWVHMASFCAIKP